MRRGPRAPAALLATAARRATIRATAVLAAAGLVAAGCHDPGLAEERRGDLVYATGGDGPGRVTVIRPARADGPLPVVLFLHGWGATEPRFYRGWVEHLARAGNAVIYPRYQDSVAEPPTQVLGNVLIGLRIALGAIDEDPGSLVVAGHSAGAGLAADYAAVAGGTALPEPRAVLSVYPGRAFRGIPFAIPAAGAVPRGVVLRVLTGAQDRVVDPADARAIVARARTRDKRLEVVRDAGASDHLGPQRDTAVARRVFWERLDALIAAVRR